MYNSITVNCSFDKNGIPVDKDWLWMEQIVGDDKASINDIAELVDTLYDIDPCIETKGAPPAEEEPTTEDLVAAAAAVFDLEECNRRKSGTYLARVKIVRSKIERPYTLRMNVGKVIKTEIVSEQRFDNYDIKEESYIQLKYPIVNQNDIRVSWLGPVYSRSGGSPQIKLIGNTAFWGESVTGSFRIEYATQYEIVTIEVPGIPNYIGSELGDPQEANLLAFYLYLVYPLTISPPDYSGEDEDTLAEICGWSGGSQLDQPEEPEPIPEPPPPPEYGCIIESLRLGDPYYYFEQCCEWPSGINPNRCDTRTEPNPGGKTLPQETIDKLTNEWPGPIEFIGVGPDGPDGCGKIYYEQKVNRRPCCDEVEPMAWDSDFSVEILAPGTRGIVGVIGGRPPYSWSIRGTGFALNAEGTIRDGVSNDSRIWVYAGPDACGTAQITVDDGCSVVSGLIRATVGRWGLVYRSEGGLNGDPLTPPFQFAASLINSFNNSEPIGIKTGIKGKYKVTQQFVEHCSLQSTTALTLEQAVADCVSLSTGSGCSVTSQYVHIGSAFYDLSLNCMGCGSCVAAWPDPYPDYKSGNIGFHSFIYYAEPWYQVHSIWINVTNTEVYEWIC